MNLPIQSKPVRRQSNFTEVINDEVNPSVCITGDINGNKVCVDIPILGNQCFTLPHSIPIGATAQACTCGSFIPTGAKVTVKAAGVTLWSKTIGSC
ncbi:hypothetical protein [Aquimarina algiphila]|uniref:hypothetical protein n=1 Tax=Aquimarina algiphila TaxID=2047982 RepID=UPI0023308D8E|nr:hypothetical protein [Aquimarina algiphila]